MLKKANPIIGVAVAKARNNRFVMARIPAVTLIRYRTTRKNLVLFISVAAK
jgi:hypothetical protein